MRTLSFLIKCADSIQVYADITAVYTQLSKLKTLFQDFRFLIFDAGRNPVGIKLTQTNTETHIFDNFIRILIIFHVFNFIIYEPSN